MENGSALRCYNAAGQLMVNTAAPIAACSVINVSISVLRSHCADGALQ